MKEARHFVCIAYILQSEINTAVDQQLPNSNQQLILSDISFRRNI